jgi:flagellar hook protein FlgE
MGFQTALSGLKGASTTLSVTGNNIANSQSVGFKESRAQFGDVYASSMGKVGKQPLVQVFAFQTSRNNLDKARLKQQVTH